MGKYVEGSGHDIIFGAPVFALRDWEILRNPRVVGVPTEIRSGHAQNTNQVRYNLSQLAQLNAHHVNKRKSLNIVTV
jgi:hypothetical protein